MINPRNYIHYLDYHDDVIKWKHFPRYWSFVRGIHRSPVNFTHKGQWRGALMFSFICPWRNGWVNYREAGDLRRHRAHYDVILMIKINNLDISTPATLLVIMAMKLIAQSTSISSLDKFGFRRKNLPEDDGCHLRPCTLLTSTAKHAL